MSLAAQAQSGITDIGTLGGTISAATSVSADGGVVVGNADTAGNAAQHAFRWANGSGMVDLGTLGGTTSSGRGISADGTAVVGTAYTAGNAAPHAFRWTSGSGMVDLGTLGGTTSYAWGISGDGAVVVGYAAMAGNVADHAFRWTSGSGMVDLGALSGSNSFAYGVSGDGTTVVGSATITGDVIYHAFRWTSGSGMVDLGTLGGSGSFARGVSGDGTVVVGYAQTVGNAAQHAYRWTSGSGMVDLGTLGGTTSSAFGISSDGTVVVGSASTVTATRAFRWTQSTGMQSVENWLRANGVTVATDTTNQALATNADGSVVVGNMTNSQAFIARVGGAGSGLITLADVQSSLNTAASGGGMALRSGTTLINGVHSDPLMRRVGVGQNNFWIAGDWGRDDHGARNGDIGLAEVGLGRNFGPVQLNVSVGQTWATQNLLLNGRTSNEGDFVLAEALIPLSGNLWATLGAYSHHGEADLRRGYLNAGAQDASTASSITDTQGVRARLEWDKALQLSHTDVSPYADLSQAVSKLGAYTETGGGFPARFDARTEKATELRLGINTRQPFVEGMNLVGTLEAAHRFEKNGARTSGEMIGLFSFNLDGQQNKQDWVRARLGVEGRLAGGFASLAVNVTTQGETPSAWVAANWQTAF